MLMVHGLEVDMMEWVYNDANMAPVFILAEAGYDVWMGNSRGTRYSNKHKTLDPSKKPYWEFTWEEMGTKDVPAFVDCILKETKYKQVTYIGHS